MKKISKRLIQYKYLLYRKMIIMLSYNFYDYNFDTQCGFEKHCHFYFFSKILNRLCLYSHFEANDYRVLDH